MSMSRAVVDAATKVADAHSIPRPCFLAILQVETSGQGCWADGMPVVLCEPYRFWKALPADRRREATRAGLATPRWTGKYPGQGTEAGKRQVLARMVALDEDAAYRSVSMGIGQVMGDHAADLGYPSAKAMFDAFRGDVAAQVDAVARLLPRIHALGPLLARNWAAVAKAYNGAGYARNRYDRKLAAAYALWDTAFRSGRLTAPEGDAAGLHSTGPAVKALQEQLSRVMPGRLDADGAFWSQTQDKVAAFQAAHGLPGTGVVDQTTADALFAAEPMTTGARAAETVGSLAHRSRIIQGCRKLRAVHLASAGGLSAIVGGWLDKAGEWKDHVDKAKDLGVLDLVVAHPWPAVAAGAAVAVVASELVLRGVIGARVDDERTGVTAS